METFRGYVVAGAILFFMKFGRTDLRTDVSQAKFDEEADFEVRSAVASQKRY